MNRALLIAALGCLPAALGCEREAQTGPPAIGYASDVCDQCNMIISDERFAAAMRVVEPDGFTTSVIFDDLNCMVRYESANDGLTVLNRWTHHYLTNAWLEVSEARFVQSDDLVTPMGSHVAAFATEAEADGAAESLGGEPASWESLREQFTGGG